ncbi:AAA family ATPase, partial [Thermoanaerobacter sp. AC272]
YLIIDEYDHFANDIIAMGDSEFYREIVRASGFVRDFYETLKIGTKRVIDRIFITGISPIMLDDLTSGFNIALNVTMDLSLNEMLGFTEEEVVKVLEEVGIEEKEREKSLEELKELY